MELWNYSLITLGVIRIICNFIRQKLNNFDEKYLEKLEMKYGSIDKEKAMKFYRGYDCINSVIVIIVGLLIRDNIVGLICISIGLIISSIIYYLLRKNYIVIK